VNVRDQATEWTSRVWGDREGFACLAVGFGPHYDANAKYKHRTFQPGFHRWPDEAETLLDRAMEYAERGDVYIAPLLRSSFARTKDNALPGTSLWADVDELTLESRGLDQLLIGPGGLLVGSGHGRHVYLRLPEPLEPAEIERWNRRLARALGADAKWDAAALLRLPGTFNHKEACRGGDLLPVTILNGDRAPKDWTLDELAQLLPDVTDANPLDVDRPVEPVMPEMVPAHLLARLDEEPGEDRSKQSHAFVAACLDARLTDSETLAVALQHRPTKDKYGSRAAAEIIRMIMKMRGDDKPIPRSESVSESVGGTGSSPPSDGGRTEPIPPIPYVRESVRESVAVPPPSAPPVEVVFQSAAAFAEEDEPNAEMILGYDDDDAAFVAGGTVVIFGKGGGGKTTLINDISCHLSTGTDWQGLKAPKARRVAVVESDGPRGRFRRKIRAKLAAWTGDDPGDNLVFLTEPWGQLKLSREDHRAALAAYINEHKVDVLVAGPIVSIGMIGGGTPDEVAAFEAHLQALRGLLDRPLLVVLLHHTNQRGQISGAWDRVPDTLMFVVNTGKSTRLVWQKARDSSTLHAASWKLKWAEGMSFELDDSPDVTEDDIEEAILAAVAANPGKSWTAVAKPVKGNAKTKATIRDRLIAEGRLVNRGKGQSFALWSPDDLEDEEPGRGCVQCGSSEVAEGSLYCTAHGGES
jgi:AAA domain/RepB DNA-primase from phage plasmid